MLSLIGKILKLTVFAVLVLIVAHYAKWNGKTISDQVKTQLSHAEKAKITTGITGKVKDWSGKLTDDAREGDQRRRISSRSEADLERIPPSERQKLRALIQELNQSHLKD